MSALSASLLRVVSSPHRLCLTWIMLTLLACNPHPVEPLEGVVSAVTRQSSNLPDKTKIDFLFVVDNSGSMIEEQENLARNFETIAEFLSALGPSADYRVAVTSTDLGQNNTGRSPNGDESDNGRFLVKPDPEYADENCPSILENAGINAESPVLLSSRLDENPQIANEQIVERFGCMATLGKRGSGSERGLEAMRKALSCNYDNAKFFAQCCVPDPLDTTNRLAQPIGELGAACTSPGGCKPGLTCVDNGGNAQCLPISTECPAPCPGTDACVSPQMGAASCLTVTDSRRKIYNPVCEPEVDPLFLRPDSLLVVIFVTDENDCSAPRDNRADSTKVICRYNIVDNNGDNIPDGYLDPALCPSRNPAECFQAECGALSAEDCFKQRCMVNFEDYRQDQVLFACEYEDQDLTDVGDYFRFLTSLKAQPREQLVVANIAGPNKFTPLGSPVYFESYEVAPMCQEELNCTEGIIDPDDAPDDHPDCRLRSDVSYITDECCPNGQCRGGVRSSCVSERNGVAYSGRRYQRLVGALEANGIGCPDLNPDRVTDEQRAACAGQRAGDECTVCDSSSCRCMPIANTVDVACGTCVQICSNDFSAPLDAIRSKVTDVLGTYCLDKPPACLVREGNEGLTRDCVTDAELSDGRNYEIFVRVDCEPEATDCLSRLAETRRTIAACTDANPANDADCRWRLELDVQGCSGGALVRMEPVPPAGSLIDIEFFVSTEGDEESASEAGDGSTGAEILDGSAAPVTTPDGGM